MPTPTLLRPSGEETLMVSWAIAVLAASVIRRAANAIPRVHVGTYIFISFSGC